MKFLGDYSNGWGHVIMSIALLGVAVVMFVRGDPTLIGYGVGLVTTVSGYWLVTSAANTAAKSAEAVAESKKQVQE
jgi:hypothetical protein